MLRILRVALLAALLLAPAACNLNAEQELGDTNMDSLVLEEDLTVGNNATVEGDLAVTGTTALTGALTSSGGLSSGAGDLSTGTGQLDVGAWVNLSAGTAISVTAGAIITPTVTFQPLTSGSAVTTSTTTAIANGSEVGNLLILINNNASDTITIDGTGANVECKTDKVLGAKDTLTLIWGTADWYCLALHDNS